MAAAPDSPLTVTGVGLVEVALLPNCPPPPDPQHFAPPLESLAQAKYCPTDTEIAPEARPLA